MDGAITRTARAQLVKAAQPLMAYIQSKRLSFTYWSLNPNSGDTGGILGDDWQTLRQDKMDVLKPALAPLIQ